MSCCPTVPDIQASGVSPDEPEIGEEPAVDPDKPVDCTEVANSNKSTTGQVNDKTQPIPDRIQQHSIVTKFDGTIDMIFTTSGPTPVTSWVFNPTSYLDSVTTSGARLSGTFANSLIGTRLTLSVEAIGASGRIDKKTFAFSPSKYDAKTAVKLLHPLPGSVVTSGYGPRKPPVQGASSFHAALDFAYLGGVAKEVICSADGEVVWADTQTSGKGYGNYVIVQHKGADGRLLISTVYAHLEKMYVSKGQKVAAGQSLGKEGNTGHGSGKHLHFEVRLPNNAKVDPTPYLFGGTKVAIVVNPDNTPGAGGTTDAEGDKGLTREQVTARITCQT
jgi:murein DD-endopeptidase MepM/ murein hydrolase activator NlpD